MVDTYDVSLRNRPAAIRVEHKCLTVMLQSDHQRDVRIALTAVLKCLPKQTVSSSGSLLAFCSRCIFLPLPERPFLCRHYLYFSPESSNISREKMAMLSMAALVLFNQVAHHHLC
ncbi:hypothetical protein V6Z98_005596 [Aspergillus fumigatus]